VTRLTELKSHLAIPLHDGACLRPVSPSDITDAYVDGLNDPVVNKFLGQSRKNRQTRDTVHAYVQANERDPHGVLLGMFIDGALRGTVRLHDIQEHPKVATIGVLVFDKNYWRQGWASRAIAAVVEFGTLKLGIRKFKAGMVAENSASRNTFASLGFRHRPELDRIDGGNVVIQSWDLDVPGPSPP
jgi:[ribosomal protein S5]-alanine N-acetyltransferase